MFESAELGHQVDRTTYERAVPPLREALLNAQYDLFTANRFPVLIVIGGVDGAGKGETVNLLNKWMDPRHVHTYSFAEASDEPGEERSDQCRPSCSARPERFFLTLAQFSVSDRC